ncbi:putative PAS/PAC sensor protein [Chloroherpeton thalassium ATCC 35110]|uniref:Putative PAS/PAC sensor protein n=1 Tax=Chloroherpeton thalassium (strain ATCC 35110 / GB-78) TaxID=517418 RepID=B3QWA0_CHLT3|nr:PAS domain-containing protein [Chloroherpeton thalassium]ACF13213.1 putative PAS/PAC sensor protein [Chloroherpeton thalassium ATCC 35110]
MSEHHIDKSLLIKAIDKTSEGIAISDARQPDNPLIFVNNGFTEITGYNSEEILGKNCRFLQGPETNKEASQMIRESLGTGKHCVVELRNHKKNGEAFWNRLSLNPIRDENGEITHFVGIQSDITESKKLEEMLTSLVNAFLVYFGSQDNSYERTLDDLNKIISKTEVTDENRERIGLLKKLIEAVETSKF